MQGHMELRLHTDPRASCRKCSMSKDLLDLALALALGKYLELAFDLSSL